LIFTHAVGGDYDSSLATLRVIHDDPAFAGDHSRLLDLNVDGIDDLVVGRTGGTSSFAGVVRIYHGPQSGTVYESAQAWDTEIIGNPDEKMFGFQLHLTDLSGDGIPDLVVGSYEADTSVEEGGAVYVFFGPITSDRAASDADVSILGTSLNGRFGLEMDTPGDITGDGLPDLLVGENGGREAGRGWIIPAPLTAGTYEIDDIGWVIEPARARAQASGEGKVLGVGRNPSGIWREVWSPAAADDEVF